MCDKEPKGIRRVGTFLTATALLAAILTVWAQLWPNMLLAWDWVEYPRLSFNVGLGLSWIYAALALTLLALLIAAFKSFTRESDRTPEFAFGLFLAALVMAILNVVQSLFSVAYKVAAGRHIFETMTIPDCLSWFTLGYGVSIVILSLLVARWRWFWWLELIWVVGGATTAGVGVWLAWG